MQEVRLVLQRREVMHVFDELAKAMHVAFQSPDAEDIEAVFGQRACLVEAADVDPTSDIDPTW